MSNVVILTRVKAFNVDALNRTAKCESDIDNGCIFKLDTQSVVDGEGMVWDATAPTASSDKNLWMATSPEVVITKSGANKFRNIDPDPRSFTNYAGEMIDATKLEAGDTITMSGAGITGISTTTNIYLVPTSGFTLVAATSAGTGFALKKIKPANIAIGNSGIVNEAVKGYKFVCENN